ncbi:neuroguidin [Cetorhinus maximus]
MLSMYLCDLAYVIQRKLTGVTLREEPALLRLVEIRTVLEKMRPIDQKLRYQIDKLVKTALTGTLGVDDPLTFRPNPGNMISKVVEDEGDGDEEEDEQIQTKGSGLKSKKIYIPPRLVPMHYDADQTRTEKERKVLERAKRRALSSSVIRELQEQYADTPEEQCEGRGYHAMRHSREEAHRVRYEESMMVRLNVPKKDRQKRALAMTSQLGSLTHFGSIGALTGETPDTDSAPRRKKRKSFQRRGKVSRRS